MGSTGDIHSCHVTPGALLHLQNEPTPQVTPAYTMHTGSTGPPQRMTDPGRSMNPRAVEQGRTDTGLYKARPGCFDSPLSTTGGFNSLHASKTLRDSELQKYHAASCAGHETKPPSICVHSGSWRRCVPLRCTRCPPLARCG